MDGQQVSILKDGGCYTNMISRKLLNINRSKWAEKLMSTDYRIAHSKNGTEELSIQCLESMELKVQGHKYSSNWAVGDARYDVILGMPWHAQCVKSTNYTNRTVKLKDGLELQAEEHTSEQASLHVSTISIKQFRRKLRKGKIVELYHISMNNMRHRKSQKTESGHPERKLKGINELGKE